MKRSLTLIIFVAIILCLQACNNPRTYQGYEALSEEACQELAHAFEDRLGKDAMITTAEFPDIFFNMKADESCQIEINGSSSEINFKEEFVQTGWNFVKSGGRMFDDAGVVSNQFRVDRENAICDVIEERDPVDAALCTSGETQSECYQRLSPDQITKTIQVSCVQERDQDQFDRIEGWYAANQLIVNVILFFLSLLGLVFLFGSKNVASGCIGIFLSAPVIAFLLGILFVIGKLLALKDWGIVEPDFSGEVGTWIYYCLQSGFALFLLALKIIGGLILFMLIVGIVQGILDKSLHLIKLLITNARLILSIGLGISGAVVYGVIYGVVKTQLYHARMTRWIDGDIVPLSVLIVLIWIIGSLVVLITKRES